MSTRRLLSKLPPSLGIPVAVPVLLIYVVLGAVYIPAFISLRNVTSILFSSSVLLPAALGMQLLLILGRFDLSIGAVAALSGMIAGLSIEQSGSPLVGAFLGGLAGLLVGLANGGLVSRLRVDPLVATLAMMGGARSLALATNNGRIVSGLPEQFGLVTSSRIGGVSTLVLVALTLGLLASVLTNHAVLFRRFYAAGGNPVAAGHAGVKVERLVVLGYGLAGLGAAATGLVQASRTLSASPTVFQTLPLEAIAACVIGGSSLSGGRGTVLGTSLGLVVIVATRNLVVMLGIPVYWKDFAVGALLIVAVLAGPAALAVRRWISGGGNNHG